MPKFTIDMPEKTYTRYEVEASTVEEALEILRIHGPTMDIYISLVESGEYYSDILNPNDHAWYLLVDGDDNDQQPYRLIFGQWVTSKRIGG